MGPRRVATPLAVLALTCAAGLLATAPAASADPTLSVEEHTAVSAGQAVTITLEGLPAFMPMVAVGQCKPLITGPTDCNLPATVLGSADASGVWQATNGANTITLAESVGGVDCTGAVGACAIAVTSLTDPGAVLAAVPLTFGGNASAAPAAVAAEAPGADVEQGGDLTAIAAGAVAIAALLGLVAFAVLRRRRTI